MRRMFCGLACLGFIGLLDAEPQVTYVGDGRYACRGTDRECEPINRRNDARELQRLQSQWFDLERQEQLRLRDSLRQQDEQLQRENKIHRER